MWSNGLKREGLLLCLIGPSGGGKTTFVMRLLAEEREAVRLSVSLTTRPPRSGEREGEHYFFVSREEFMAKVDRGELFEWEEVHGNFYGTPRATVEEAIAGGVDLILDVDIRGAENFKRAFPQNTVIVFLTPPSKEVLLARLRKRGTVAESELARRLATAEREFARLVELHKTGVVDYLIVNYELDKTYEDVAAVVRAERLRLCRLEAGAVRRICSVE